MCRGCEIRTRMMTSAGRDADFVRTFLRDALTNGHDDGAAGAIAEMLPFLDAMAVKLAGPVRAAPPAADPPPPQTTTPPPPENRRGFTHAARSAEAMER